MQVVAVWFDGDCNLLLFRKVHKSYLNVLSQYTPMQLNGPTIQRTQGLIETLGSMVIFDENQAVSDINKYEFLNTMYVKIVNFLVI